MDEMREALRENSGHKKRFAKALQVRWPEARLPLVATMAQVRAVHWTTVQSRSCIGKAALTVSFDR